MNDDGPFTDDMIRGMLQRQKMQHEIIPHIEEMAQKLAAAGVASQLVTGDSAEHAVRQWVMVLKDRALALLEEKQREARKKPPAGSGAYWLDEQKLLDNE